MNTQTYKNLNNKSTRTDNRFLIIKIGFFFVCLSLTSLACKKSENPAKQIYFQVSDSLLAPCYTDKVFNFSFCPPKDCYEVPKQAFDEAKAKLDLQSYSEELINFELIRFFTDTTSNIFCTVTQILSSDLNKPDFSDIYLSILRNKIPAGRVIKATYLINTLPVVQYLIMTDSTVNFKIVFQTRDQSTLQIDYAIARSIYSEYVKRIESSIGTIMVSL